MTRGEAVTNGYNTEATRIAYFSMEISIASDIPTYSGGLGILAGDVVKTSADMKIPMAAVTLLYKKGYFAQDLDPAGNQKESPERWNPADYMTLLPERVTVTIEGRVVQVQAWQYIVRGVSGHAVPVFFLDTGVEGNSDFDRSLGDYLYGGDARYRLAQEIVLGIGGVKMLKRLGFSAVNRYHMNEGHASLLTLELLHLMHELQEEEWDVEGVRQLCVFTTHTPVPAGHDRFPYPLVRQVLGEKVPLPILKRIGGEKELNMTLLALNLSHYINGVAAVHGQVTREMFPGYSIDSITNGVYTPRWVCDCFKRLYDTYIPGWTHNPFSLRYALNLPGDELWKAHVEGKKALIDRINSTTESDFDHDVFTIGFARRATAYKRADLIFHDVERLQAVARKAGRLQIVFSGKAHPADAAGKDMIRRVVSYAGQLKDAIRIVWLEDYDANLARMLVSGVDLWLNTPRKPQEASGTSGMKAALNCVPSLSVLDGWWIEGCIEGLTGWAIGTAAEKTPSDDRDAGSLYDKLEGTIVPLYYGDREGWLNVMRHALSLNASFFNTHRMMMEYVFKAYK